jgi:16S rRNA (adenine1518-N6/adenine1519-N6)-dimethyltransferase
VDEAVAQRIATLTLDDGGTRVLEVGAGTGALTVALHSRGAAVTALEIDPALVRLLESRKDLDGVEIVEADALQFPYDDYAARGPWRMTGNLPYNVGTPLVAELSKLARPAQRMVVMLQKDVVDRLVARPSTPAFGSLTLVVSARMHVRRAFTIGRSHFYPQPNVDSSVAVLEPLGQPSPVDDFERFDSVVKAAFAYRRKTLANSLSLALGIPRERTTTALRDLNIDPEIRAEQLDLAAFAELARQLAA